MTSRTVVGRLVVVALAVLLAVGGCQSKSESELADAALQAGLAAHNAGDLAGAETKYREVLQHDPQNKYAYFNLGLIAQTQGRAQDAETNYRIAIGIDPNFPSPLFNLAILRSSAPGGLAEAIDLYRRVIALSPNDAYAHFNLGIALRQAGNAAEGDREIRAAIALDPALVDPSAPASP